MLVDLLHLFFIFLVSCSGVGLGGADKELVPADHSLPHVHLIQPDIGLPYQGLLHELASIGHQEKLEIDWREKQLSHGLFICYLVVSVQLTQPFYFEQRLKHVIQQQIPVNEQNIKSNLLINI